jgi:DNA repair protein RadC
MSSPASRTTGSGRSSCDRSEAISGTLRGSYDVYAHFRERLAAERREHFIAVLLDNKNRKLRDVTIAVGLVEGEKAAAFDEPFLVGAGTTEGGVLVCP